jgi:hypothetical protein
MAILADRTRYRTNRRCRRCIHRWRPTRKENTALDDSRHDPIAPSSELDYLANRIQKKVPATWAQWILGTIEHGEQIGACGHDHEARAAAVGVHSLVLGELRVLNRVTQ